jgi:hypothetical protein
MPHIQVFCSELLQGRGAEAATTVFS